MACKHSEGFKRENERERKENRVLREESEVFKKAAISFVSQK